MRHFAGTAPGGARHLLLYGSGLIGSAIGEAVDAQRRWRTRDVPWRWSDPDQRRAQAAVLPEAIGEAERIDIVWAAGISGFGSDDGDMAAETALVAQLGDMAQSLSRRSGQVVFHLFSSMGGLYEGQNWIGPHSVPQARRAYGRGKLAQEAMALGLGAGIAARIYRPSSVYGYAPTGRRGLFAAMVAAMLRNQPLVVYGSPHTLRDYVLAQDIGAYVAGLLAAPTLDPAVAFIGSGKPTSLAEAISTIEGQTGRRLYCRYDSAPHNALDMTVHMGALPAALPRTPLSVGVASVIQSMSRSLICQPHEPH